MICQWGIQGGVTSQTVVFPISFTMGNPPICIQTTAGNSTNKPTSNFINVTYSTKKTGFSVVQNYTNTFHWFAIGY